MLFVLLATILPAGELVLANHPISVTETQIYVTKNSARMRIRLFAEDLYLFQELEPNEQDVVPPSELKRGLVDHRKFLLDKVTLRDAKGEKYSGRVTDVQPFEIPEEGIAVDDLMLHTATYEIEFPFEEPPEFLTIQQDISDENFIFPSEMKLVLHQAGTELTYTESLKPGSAETIRFDWDSEKLADDATDEDWQAWFEKQREATLGITSYSSVYSFIYVEPAEVRHEILIPLANLKTVLPIEHSDPAFVDVSEQDGVRDLIRDWLSEGNPAQINGAVVSPEFTRIDFYGLDLKDFAQQAQQRRVSLANGRVGIIMTYTTDDDVVRDVQLTWDTFNSAMRKIQSVVFAYPDTLQQFEFSRFNTPEENVFSWQAEKSALPQPVGPLAAEVPPLPRLSVPVGSVVLGSLALFSLLFSGLRSLRVALALLVLSAVMIPFARIQISHPWKSPPDVEPSVAADVFQHLHQGTYRALDFGTKNRIYDALTTSVDGELLETLYLQLRDSLKMREQGGAVARVRSVDYEEGEQTQPADNIQWPGFQYRSRWTVSGTVEHWGHIHERQNQFCAVFSIEPRDGQWKITEMKVEDQQSIASKTRLRRF